MTKLLRCECRHPFQDRQRQGRRVHASAALALRRHLVSNDAIESLADACCHSLGGKAYFKAAFGQAAEEVMALEPQLREDARRLAKIVPKGQAATHPEVRKAGRRYEAILAPYALVFLVEQEQALQAPQQIRSGRPRGTA